MTNRQRVFIEEYLKCWNATEAARRSGYSEKTARQIGQKLLTNVVISEAIKQRISEKAMSADEVLIRLGEHARGDMADFLDISSVGFQIDLNKALQNGKTRLIKKAKMKTTITMNKDDQDTEIHDMEIELYDAQSALEKIGRYHGLFKDRQDINIEGKLSILDIGEDITKL